MAARGWRAGAALLALALGTAAVSAPSVEAQTRREQRAERRSDRREQIKKKIRALRAYRLTEDLSLDEATAGRLFPVLSRYDDETDRLLEKRVELQRQLKRADTLRDTRAIDRLIDEAVANQRAFWALEERRLAELRKILHPVQTARLLVVLPALERQIQNQLRKAIERRAGGAGPAAGQALDDDDDDALDDVPHKRAPGAAAPSNAPGNTPPCPPDGRPCR